MSTRNHAVLHEEHRHWEDDVKMWRLDIEEWQKEQAKLLADLELAMGSEVSGLHEHAKIIGEHQAKVVDHEHLLAELEQSQRPTPTEIEARMADAHEKESHRHAQMQEVHERFKRHHHRAMARLAVVLQALGSEV